MDDPFYHKIKSMKKSELHIHLGGSFPFDFLKKIAPNENDRSKLDSCIAKIKEGMKYEDCFAVFPLLSELVNSCELIEEGAYALCKFLEEDNVEYAEIRSTLKSLQGKDEEEYLKSMLKGMKRCDSIECVVVLSIQRGSTKDFVDKTVDLALKYGIKALDISGVSTSGDIGTHLDTLKKAKKCGLKITAHMGESIDETDQMLILEHLKPERIGHGVHLKEEAKQFILKHRIPVEVCPTSAKLVMHDGVHPWIKEYKKSKHPIAIGTDDPTVFGVDLTKELFDLRGELEEEDITGIIDKAKEMRFY